MRIILLFSLLFIMVGCSSYQTETYQAETYQTEAYRADDVPERPVPRSASRSVPHSVPPSIPNTPQPTLPPPRETIQTPRPQRTDVVPENRTENIPQYHVNSSSAAHYETNFDTKDKGRASNVALAASTINNTIIQPGETFSFNDTIGSTTQERGYKKSIIFVDGKKSEGYGGGVCQVSTTLCNAAHRAGMTIIERHDHSRPVNYVGDGLQAATSHNGGLDFKFQNDTQHPVIIHAKAENGTISVSVGAA
ncbi:MAG: VanW family protein [Defluviitaleaceae bacterium]|nr:VanW family protein [Defluviitaleaceae bacterium]